MRGSRAVRFAKPSLLLLCCLGILLPLCLPPLLPPSSPGFLLPLLTLRRVRIYRRISSELNVLTVCAWNRNSNVYTVYVEEAVLQECRTSTSSHAVPSYRATVCVH